MFNSKPHSFYKANAIAFAMLWMLLLFMAPLQVTAQDITGKWVCVAATDSSKQPGLIRDYIIDINKKMKLKGESSAQYRSHNIRSDASLVGKVDMDKHTMNISMTRSGTKLEGGAYVSSKIFGEQTYAKDTVNGRWYDIDLTTMNYRWTYNVDSTGEYLHLVADIKPPRHTVVPEHLHTLAKFITFARPIDIDNNEKEKPSTTAKQQSNKADSSVHLITQRSNKLFKEIIADADSIQVDLYDVGQIDGDSVALFLNGKLIAGHVLLQSTATTFKLKLDRSITENRLVLFAENLGTVPPNTAFVVITINNKEYRLNMQSDENTNGEIVFRFPK